MKRQDGGRRRNDRSAARTLSGAGASRIRRDGRSVSRPRREARSRRGVEGPARRASRGRCRAASLQDGVPGALSRGPPPRRDPRRLRPRRRRRLPGDGAHPGSDAGDGAAPAAAVRERSGAPRLPARPRTPGGARPGRGAPRHQAVQHRLHGGWSPEAPGLRDREARAANAGQRGRPDRDRGGSGHPALSPSGSRLAFVGDGGHASHTWLYVLDVGTLGRSRPRAASRRSSRPPATVFSTRASTLRVCGRSRSTADSKHASGTSRPAGVTGRWPTGVSTSPPRRPESFPVC